MPEQARITAVLGPTNTGKTHYAIERMIAHRRGIIGLPLRLLAREVYDRISALRGSHTVALVTGEERLVPPNARWWVCTVEAMPADMRAEFVAVDEIQLCADPERGHIFTDRLMHMRGTEETLFLGSDTMRNAIAELVPGTEFLRRERFSRLTHTGEKKLSRMSPRSAVVGFSAENVYANAELLRRQKGGAAVVMGALSPRTRNAQVALYQNGDVDFLVATDAIGMGLNLDINHVAFAGLSKFDGRRMRPLLPIELAQIAGRAGRHMNDGTFGVTGDAGGIPDEVIEAVESHRFLPVRRLQWRNSDLDFGSVAHLLQSLQAPTDHPWLTRVRDADDLVALRTLSEVPEVRERARGAKQVALLWDVCRIPDFRDISEAEHASMLERIFAFLHEQGRVPDDWLSRQVKRIDRTDGDIDTLSKRLAFVRTWTYVAQRNGWVDDENHWRGETRAVEDRLSDALHEALTQRFVDRRTSVLLRRLKQKENLLAEVSKEGEVTVEGQFVGRLEGFRFRQDQSASSNEAQTLRTASLQALAPEFQLRADRFYNAPDTELDFTEQGGLMWGEHAVGKLVAGSEPLKPIAEAFVDDEAGAEVVQKVQRRLQHFIDRRVAMLFEPLLAMGSDEALSGLVRGFAYRLVEALGILPREAVAAEVKELDQDMRGALRQHGVRFGQYTIFMPLLLKPAPTRLRLVLWALSKGLDEAPASPPPGLVTIPALPDAPEGYYPMCGYRLAGERAIRIDMLERLADLLRAEDSRGGFEASADMLSITGLTHEQFANLMEGLGYRATRGERQKVRVAAPLADKAPAAAAEAETEAAAGTGADAAEGASPAPTEPDTAGAADPLPEAGGDTGDAPEAAAATANQPEPDVPPQTGPGASTEDAAAAAAAAAANATGDAPASDEPEVEVFYTFVWQGRSRGRPARQGQAKRPHDGKGRRPHKGKGRDKPEKGERSKTFSAKPPGRKADRIDPDNPFAAALMGLKDKS